ncbi:MAG: preprotein translocase subunit TatC [Clostridiales bacterium]|nr:preprotein translocase subunit TatC [Clostridiales bacterium]
MNALIAFLERFRRTLIVCIVVCVVTACACYPFTDSWITCMAGLLKGWTELYQTMVGEALGARLLLSVVPGLTAAGVCALWKVLRVYRRPKPALVCAAALILFLGGGCFAALLILPLTVNMLTGLLDFTLHISLYSYIVFCLTFLVLIALMFELPLIALLLYRLGLIHAEKLRKWRRGVYLTLLIVLAILTPTQDAATLMLTSIPFVVMYEGSTLWIAALERRRARDI